MGFSEQDINGLIKQLNVPCVSSSTIIQPDLCVLLYVFVVCTDVGPLVFSDEDKMNAFVNSSHGLVKRGLFVKGQRKAFLTTDKIFILDKDQPDFGLNVLPTSEEFIKSIALSKLSPQEREVLGL